jgi:hypothetical protein
VNDLVEQGGSTYIVSGFQYNYSIVGGGEVQYYDDGAEIVVLQGPPAPNGPANTILVTGQGVPANTYVTGYRDGKSNFGSLFDVYFIDLTNAVDTNNTNGVYTLTFPSLVASGGTPALSLVASRGNTGPTGTSGSVGATGATGADSTVPGPTGPMGPTGPAGGGGGGATPGGSNTQVQYNVSGALGGSSNFVYDYTNARVGIGTNAPAAVLDVVGSSTNPIYLRAPVYSRVAVQDVNVGTNTVTVATSNSGLNYNIAHTSFSNITLPASTTASTDGGVFWLFKNNTGANLNVTLTNNANLTTPTFIFAGNVLLISVSSNTNNTFVLL